THGTVRRIVGWHAPRPRAQLRHGLVTSRHPSGRRLGVSGGGPRMKRRKGDLSEQSPGTDECPDAAPSITGVTRPGHEPPHQGLVRVARTIRAPSATCQGDRFRRPLHPKWSGWAPTRAPWSMSRWVAYVRGPRGADRATPLEVTCRNGVIPIAALHCPPAYSRIPIVSATRRASASPSSRSFASETSVTSGRPLTGLRRRRDRASGRGGRRGPRASSVR